MSRGLLFSGHSVDTSLLGGKRVRSTNLYHSRQCGIVLKLRLHIDYTAGCFTTHDCSRKLRKLYQRKRVYFYVYFSCSRFIGLQGPILIVAHNFCFLSGTHKSHKLFN